MEPLDSLAVVDSEDKQGRRRIPKTVHFVVVVLPLARLDDYFLHVNMAKRNNRG